MEGKPSCSPRISWRRPSGCARGSPSWTRGRFITEGSPRELILRHIEPHVIEAHGDGVMDWTDHEARKLASRLEKSGDTVFCYAADPAPLLASLANRGELRYLHRPANLEDVFLKLTGRELR